MNDLEARLLDELRALIADLGKDGGLISPSVYDTAQVLRLCPPEEGVEPGLAWLLSQQKADGGWGDPAVPTARDVPTIGAMLTLHTYQKHGEWQGKIEAGLEFLNANSEHWRDVNIDAIPIAAEMIVPYLIEESAKERLHITGQPYSTLFQLRKEKLSRLPKGRIAPGSAPTYSWEALGRDASSTSPDPTGGIGHSPAATAAWLRYTECGHSRQIRDYLRKSSQATQLDIPGVVPCVWPISEFEISYGLYALSISGLYSTEAIVDVASSKASDLYDIAKRCNGVSFSHRFVPDVDGTAVSVIALSSFGYQLDSDIVNQFRSDDHFHTYAHELNPSVLANSHALHALHVLGNQDATGTFLLDRQCLSGHWMPDKWHSSWRYTTLEVLLALLDNRFNGHAKMALRTIADDQKLDGGWGMSLQSTPLETAYCVLALLVVADSHGLERGLYSVLESGIGWLKGWYLSGRPYSDQYWLGKELYSPSRVDRIYVLATLLSTLIGTQPAFGDQAKKTLAAEANIAYPVQTRLR